MINIRKLICIALAFIAAACAAPTEKHIYSVEQEIQAKLPGFTGNVRVIDRGGEAEISIVFNENRVTVDDYNRQAANASIVTMKIMQRHDLKLNILSVRLFQNYELLFDWYTFDFNRGFLYDMRRPAALYFADVYDMLNGQWPWI